MLIDSASTILFHCNWIGPLISKVYSIHCSIPGSVQIRRNPIRRNANPNPKP